MGTVVHWLGVGLSSTAGIAYLARKPLNLVIWNRNVGKARATLEKLGVTADLRQLDMDALRHALNAGDILVSMLPAQLHPQFARLCLEKKAHFVSSSYISPDMAALDEAAKAKEIALVNEVGLDPGIDHLFAHLLVENFKNSGLSETDTEFYFRSYCGGFPKVANEFRYKFSWSPLGVLRALTSQAQWLENGAAHRVTGPWEAIKQKALGPAEEVFEAYPNRDSLPFRAQYGFSPEWNVREFVRGTLRLEGWTAAWTPLFEEIRGLKGEAGEKRLQNIAEELERKYSYDPGEADRVVLSVSLEVKRDGHPIWHQEYYMDSTGNQTGHAMARLVSLPVSFAVEAVMRGDIGPGVSAAPSDPKLIAQWLDQLKARGEDIVHIDHSH